MRGEDIIKGSICVHKHFWCPGEGGISYDIESIVAGLSGGCVSVMIRINNQEIKLYLNLPMVIHSNLGMSALFAIAGRYNSVHESETRLYNWLSTF